MGMTPEKWQEFIDKSKQMRKQAADPQVSLFPDEDATKIPSINVGNSGFRVSPQDESYHGNETAYQTLQRHAQESGNPVGYTNRVTYRLAQDGFEFTPDGRIDLIRTERNKTDPLDFLDPGKASMSMKDIVTGVPAATMRGLSSSGWGTVRAGNTFVLKGIPAAASAMRKGSYDPIMATVDAVRNGGDFGNWSNYYNQRINQTNQDMDMFYVPARAVENYANSVQQYGNENTWVDPRGYDYNDYYKGYEKVVEFAGDMAQFYGFSMATKPQNLFGKTMDTIWRSTGPAYNSDAPKLLNYVTKHAPQGVQSAVHGYQNVMKNPFVRNGLANAANGTPLEGTAHAIFSPGSSVNGLISDAIAYQMDPKQVPSYYEAMPDMDQYPQMFAYTNTSNTPMAYTPPAQQDMYQPVLGSYQPVQAQTPSATYEKPVSQPQVTQTTRQMPQPPVGTAAPPPTRQPQSHPVQAGTQKPQQGNFGVQQRGNFNTNNAANSSFNRQPTANGGTVTKGTNFTNTRDANGHLTSVTAGNVPQTRKGF